VDEKKGIVKVNIISKEPTQLMEAQTETKGTETVQLNPLFSIKEILDEEKENMDPEDS
ncbi:hypothetical protein KI387_026614, partial [Taxus chinensis]